jgi:hypothetical protein
MLVRVLKGGVLVSMEPITSSNQTSGAYWLWIKTKFDEYKIADKKYRKMHMQCNQNMMQHSWCGTHMWVRKHHDYRKIIRNRQESDASMQDHVCCSN